eukprot:7723750-Alexandrium_andersonii.AAC.1
MELPAVVGGFAKLCAFQTLSASGRERPPAHQAAQKPPNNGRARHAAAFCHLRLRKALGPT